MFPFLDVTLVVAQDVIEKILIAKAVVSWSLRVAPNATDIAHLPIHPLRELKVMPASKEQMHVIGHDQISSEVHIKFVTSSADVGFKCLMGCL
jgi:hypothetical protein